MSLAQEIEAENKAIWRIVKIVGRIFLSLIGFLLAQDQFYNLAYLWSCQKQHTHYECVERYRQSGQPHIESTMEQKQ